MNWDQTFNTMEAGASPVPTTLPSMLSARDLQVTEFPPISWIVRDLLPEGVTLFAASPSSGSPGWPFS